jgi:hypothetical protein
VQTTQRGVDVASAQDHLAFEGGVEVVIVSGCVRRVRLLPIADG